MWHKPGGDLVDHRECIRAGKRSLRGIVGPLAACGIATGASGAGARLCGSRGTECTAPVDGVILAVCAAGAVVFVTEITKWVIRRL